MKFYKFYLISLVVIFIDQVTKLLVYFYMPMGTLGEIHLLGNILKLHYTLNPGMAFGIQFGLVYGKLILTLCRLAAMAGIAYYLYTLIAQKMPKDLCFCIALILGGAIGNVIDSVFYGVLLNNSPYDAVTPWFHGQVIDMIYVDIWEGFLPNFIPFMGGQYYSLWPIFNVADSAIFCAVAYILIFQKRLFAKLESTQVPISE